jgi:hypothetical protein
VKPLLDAVKEMVRLKALKRKIEAGKATQLEETDYSTNRETCWLALEAALAALPSTPAGAVLSRLKEGEPYFVLRGQDITAEGLVIQWSNRARKNGCPDAKCDQALDIAKHMAEWPVRKYPD